MHICHHRPSMCPCVWVFFMTPRLLGVGIAAFIALGGSLHNFYMWFGGNMIGNFSDTNRGSHLTPGYANSAPLASDGRCATCRCL